jgi:hypothetical protein
MLKLEEPGVVFKDFVYKVWRGSFVFGAERLDMYRI